MLGVSSIKTSKKPTVDKVPTLLPPTPEEDPRKAQNVKLLPDFWAELSETSAFHTDVWKEIDPKAPSVPRNDLVDGFLRWANEVYWDDVGGKPKNAEDRAAKVKLKAEKLRAEMKKQKASKK